MTRKLWIPILLSLCLITGPSVAMAEVEGVAEASVKKMSPLQTVQYRIDKVVAVLNDAELAKPANRKAQWAKIWEIAVPMFDFTEISRRTVGPKWTTFSEPEQHRFTTLFSKFLANTFIGRLQGEYHNEKIAYVKELIREPKALVRTNLVRDNVEQPIDFRLNKKGDQWKVYDILVEDGVSIVQNYRVQFQSILAKETPAQLIARLEDKVKEQKNLPNSQVQ